MHGRAGPMHGVEDYQVTRAVLVALVANDSSGVTGLLKIYGGKKGLINIGSILHGTLCKISLDADQKLFVGLESAVR